MKRINRRQFIGTTAAATALAAPSFRIKAADKADKKLKVGLIGCGWYGMVDLRAAFQVGGIEVIALCDVDSEHLEQTTVEVAKLQSTRPKTFKDYRELLEVQGLEVVFIATPPHWHALPFIAACEKGLDIYCEKPLAYDVREGEAMVAAAKRAGVKVQIGFQRRQSDAIQQAGRYVRQGKAGKLVQVNAHIHYQARMRDTTIQEPPASLDWDFWCGPAPQLPYRPNIGHFAWRLEEEYGHGHLVDWGIHLMDAVRNILGEPAPKAVQAAGGIYHFKDQITTPDVLTAQFEFEQCPVIWEHRIWGASEYSPEVSNGIFFYGEKETVFATDSKWMIISGKKAEDRKEMDLPSSEMQVKQVGDFLEAVKSRQRQPVCPPEDGFHSTTTVQLGMLAYHAGARIEWDGRNITNHEAAAKRLKREYRSPWRRPGQG